jgi:hypothetical protein
VLLKVREVGERAHVVALEAPEGAVTAQVSVTVPVNEIPGVTVITEVPVEFWPTVVLLGLLESAKPLLLVLLGACQKSPHPAKSGTAASNNRAHFPIFIAAPRSPLFRITPWHACRPAVAFDTHREPLALHRETRSGANSLTWKVCAANREAHKNILSS